MNNTYTDLVHQTFHFPQDGFEVDESYLYFNGLDIKKLIDKYGTPFKLTFLPKIGTQISKAKKLFNDAIRKHKYDGKYYYCYCTKSSHFSFIVEETLRHNVHLETSFAYCSWNWNRGSTASTVSYCCNRRIYCCPAFVIDRSAIYAENDLQKQKCTNTINV